MLVTCVLKSGGIYNASHVERLQRSVAKHLPIKHRFVCLSDVDVPCERIVLRNDWPGWWSKMELFWRLQPVLYFDLDTLICGDLTDIATQAAMPEFTVLRDFYRESGIGSGMMAWGVDMKPLYHAFGKDPSGFINKYGSRGDQAFIEDHADKNLIVKWQDRLPGQVVSYKTHVRHAKNTREQGTGLIPSNARVVCLHGRPKFDDMPVVDPVRQAWEAA